MLNIISATLEINTLCNLHCEHCFTDSEPDGVPVEMDVEDVRTILRDLQDHNKYQTIEIWLSGGEPVLHHRFADLVSLIGTAGHRVILASNGMYDERGLERVVTTKRSLHRVHLSLEGMRESNDCIRGAGVFDHLVGHTIPQLRGDGVRVCVTVHLRKRNQYEIRALSKLIIDELDCDLKLGVLRPIGRARRHLIPEMLSPGELHKCVMTIYELKNRYADKRIWHDWDILNEGTKFYTQNLQGCESCPAGRQTTFSCTPHLNIFPCPQLRTPWFRLGNLKEQGSLLSVFASATSRAIHQQLRTKPTDCLQCKFYKVSCYGGCPAIQYGLSGDPRSVALSDPYCFATLL